VALLCGNHLDRLRILAIASVVRLNSWNDPSQLSMSEHGPFRRVRFDYDKGWDYQWGSQMLTFLIASHALFTIPAARARREFGATT
jgi:hypothetical protein